MRQTIIVPARLAILLLLHTAGAGLASPNVLVARLNSRTTEWLPTDNQTVYRLDTGSRRLELNTSFIKNAPVHVTISPCTPDIRWTLFRGLTGVDGHINFVEDRSGTELATISTIINKNERYILQLSSTKRGGAVAVSVRGEKPKFSRLRLRVRSRRRLAAFWDPSPIDPQATNYCVVASQKRNYTSLCAAQHDLNSYNYYEKLKRSEVKTMSSAEKLGSDKYNGTYYETFDQNATRFSNELDSGAGADFRIYDAYYNNVYRRKKFGRSTKVTEQDPFIVCIGERTHHLIENLDPSKTYHVSVFGVGSDRQAGALLATSRVLPKTSVANRLRENTSVRTQVSRRRVFYYKATMSPGGGLWLAVSTCGGAVDIEVSVRGKRLLVAKNIEPHRNIFVPVPTMTSSIQETSEDSSIQFDSSSSEEARLRYVIKVAPSLRNGDGVFVELTASAATGGVVNSLELSEDSSIVRELRPRRTCRSVDIAFLTVTQNSTDVVRYCVLARESSGAGYCGTLNIPAGKKRCVNHLQRSKVIKQKINNLKPGRKYEIQVTASNKYNLLVPYRPLFVDTDVSCL